MVKIISLGNELRGDDSIGPAVIEQLNKSDLSVPMNLIDAGTDAFTILDHLIGEDPIIIVDCMKMGAEPGNIKKFNIEEVTIRQIEKSISLHGFGFGEIYDMAKDIGDVAECTLIGIEPKSIDFGEVLSDEVKDSLPFVVKMVIEEANKYGG
jgi:hydrogenase maturation protease